MKQTATRTPRHAGVIVAATLAALVLPGPGSAGPQAASYADVPREVLADWLAQDAIGPARAYEQAIRRTLVRLGARGADLQAGLDALAGTEPTDPRWGRLYEQVCARRRGLRLATLRALYPRIVFTKRRDFSSSFYAYTEGQSDAQHERCFAPDARLCVLKLDGLYGEVQTLLHDPTGVIRDPDVSWDGRRILFAWKQSLNDDDYHLYEMDVATQAVRQLTDGLGFADYEGVYAPNGDIIFNSTRCVQTVDCWWTEASNLYTCDPDGRFLRRLTVDQVHDNFPSVTPDGRVIYTRWDYSDRGQMFPQGLFQMFPDGTGQAELYGNNSYFPTTIAHARAIPGTGQYVAVFIGHHTLQKGWLGILDPARGRQENEGAQLIAPVRVTEPVREDYYGQTGDQFQYPYPVSATEFVVALRPAGSEAPFALYWVNRDGDRELLAADARLPCNQSVPLAARPLPHVRPAAVDYRQTEGVYYMQDVYSGTGLTGVPRGTVKRLRVVALDFRPAGVGSNCNSGPAGQALVNTPVAIGNGAWDVKTVLGEATVYADGSAMFAVPALRPVYFQAVDERGYVVQTMRSWATLQPGEHRACVGCHESKNEAPPVERGFTAAMRAGVETLAGFQGPPRGFSFTAEVQPILDRHCIRCHFVEAARPWRAAAIATPARRSHADTPPAVPDSALPPSEPAFSLRGDRVRDVTAKRFWSESYLALTHAAPQCTWDCVDVLAGQPDETLNWVHAQSGPELQPPYSAGAARSRLLRLVEEGHGGAQLSRMERDKLACWVDLLVPFCGSYTEAAAWTDEEHARFRHFAEKRARLQAEERRNIQELLEAAED